MARHTTILSFDDVKRSNAARAASRSVCSNANSDLQGVDSEIIDFAAIGAARRNGVATRSFRDTSFSYETQSRQASRSYNGGRNMADVRHTRLSDRVDAEEEQQSENSAQKGFFAQMSDKLEAKKRSRTKERAGKQFNSQYAGKNDSVQTGPRAAVYKAEMGSQQRKANRMQNNAHTSKHAHAASPTSLSTAGSKAVNPIMALFGLVASFLPKGKGTASSAAYGNSAVQGAGAYGYGPKSRAKNAVLSFLSGKKLGAAVVTAFLLYGCFTIYPAAQQYYVELRNTAKLQAEYDAVIARNDELNTTVSNLESDEGIKQMARDNYGWVEDGENGVNVYGLSGTTEENASIAYKGTNTVSAPETWYSVFLDPFFGVK